MRSLVIARAPRIWDKQVWVRRAADMSSEDVFPVADSIRLMVCVNVEVPEPINSSWYRCMADGDFGLALRTSRADKARAGSTNTAFIAVLLHR